jgi:hypothetical protein
MNNFKRLIIGILFIAFSESAIQAQIWPFSSMIRFGNTVYCPIDSLLVQKITSTNFTIRKGDRESLYGSYNFSRQYRNFNL